ncbi:MAG: LPS export ABC transporter periplasmic protein LptC [Gemmatimonadales bacterium]|nr:MAG: LPS export ABC transporter periplasmic protein LptC [Gemmatimonadales bacterium]
MRLLHKNLSRKSPCGMDPCRMGVAVLALLSVGIISSACENEAPVATVPAEYLQFDADGVVFQMTHRFTQEGVLQAMVIADTAIQWHDSTAVALRVVDLRVFDEDGSERAQVTSRRGTLDTRTERMTAQGNVVMVIPADDRTIESQELHYDPRGERIWSDSAFVMRHQGRVLRGTSFTSDLEFRNFVIRGSGT